MSRFMVHKNLHRRVGRNNTRRNRLYASFASIAPSACGSVSMDSAWEEGRAEGKLSVGYSRAVILLACIFHTPKRRVRARGLQERRVAVAGRVPSRGALSAFQSGYEICGLGSWKSGYGLSVKWKVAPCPAALSAQMRPPCRSMIRRTVASPMPEPGNSC